jgi:hypothetical protein
MNAGAVHERAISDLMTTATSRCGDARRRTPPLRRAGIARRAIRTHSDESAARPNRDEVERNRHLGLAVLTTKPGTSASIPARRTTQRKLH